jgi:hypothetical protein
MKNLPKYLTKVSTLSKLVALALFVLFPFLGFYLGLLYQQKLCVKTEPECLEDATSSESDDEPIDIPETAESCWEYDNYPRLANEYRNNTLGNTFNEATERMYSQYRCSLDLESYLRVTFKPQSESFETGPSYCSYTDKYLFATVVTQADVSAEDSQGIIYEYDIETGTATEITRTSISTGVIESLNCIPWNYTDNYYSLIVYNAGTHHGACTDEESCNAFETWLTELCTSNRTGTFIFNPSTGATTRVADSPDCLGS